jgi:hypothetical protein
MKIKKRPKKQQEFDDVRILSVKVDDQTCQALAPTKFVWHRGELSDAGWSDVQEFKQHPEPADFPRLVGQTDVQPYLVHQIRAASHIRGLFAARDEWEGELIYTDPLDANCTTKMFTSWWDTGLCLNIVVEFAWIKRVEMIVVLPGPRLRGASPEALLADVPDLSYGRDLALKIATSELESPTNRSLIFTFPLRAGDRSQPRDLMRDLQLATIRGLLSATADRDSFEKTDYIPPE